MALPATAVAGFAVGLPGRIHLCIHGLVNIGPCVYHFLERRQAHVKAAVVIFCNISVTRPAGPGRVRIGWVFCHTDVCCFPIRVIRITAVAFMTADFAVIFILCY